MISALAASLLALAFAAGTAHPNSYSYSRIEVRGQRLVLLTSLQHLSLLEVLPALDTDGDGALSQPEVDAGRDELEGYVLSHYLFWTGTTAEPGSGQQLAGRLVSAESEIASSVFGDAWVHVEIEHAAPAPIADLRVEMVLFAEVPDDHVDGCRIDWNGLQEIDVGFSLGYPTWRMPPERAPRRRGPLAWAGFGARDATSHWGVLGLVLALALAARSRRALVGVAVWTGFAVPAGVALAALDAMPLEPRFVELVAALAVAYVAATNVLSRDARRLWPEAALFGLVEGAAAGLAFLATPAQEEVAWETSRAVTLVAYAAPAGLAAAALALALSAFARLPGLARVRLACSAALALAGLAAFAQRAGWLPY